MVCCLLPAQLGPGCGNRGRERAMSGTLGEAESPAQLAELVARDAALLALREAQLVAAQKAPELRRLAKDAATAGVVLAALAAAFAFANWALADALSGPLPGWRAPLVLAAVWAAVALLVTVILMGGKDSAKARFDRATGPADIPGRELAVGEAEEMLRQRLEELSGAIALAAERRLTRAILPLAGGMVAVGEEMLEATGDVVEAAEEVVELLEESVPGGLVIRDVIAV